MDSQANALISAEHVLYSCNVSSGDLASRNVLWPDHRDQHPMPVLIDFDTADILYPSRQADGLYRYAPRMLTSIRSSLLAVSSVSSASTGSTMLTCAHG